jgi:hypothetical protein
MCYLHEMIINHICKVISREPISLYQYEIILHPDPLRLAVHQVVDKRHVRVGGLEPNTMLLAIVRTPLRTGGVYVPALAIVVRVAIIGVLHVVFLDGIKLLRRAETTVCVSTVHELIRMSVVFGQSLGLKNTISPFTEFFDLFFFFLG